MTYPHAPNLFWEVFAAACSPSPGTPVLPFGPVHVTPLDLRRPGFPLWDVGCRTTERTQRTNRIIPRILLAACAGDANGPSGAHGANEPRPEPTTPRVVVRDGSLVQGSGQQTLTLHVRNDGSAGSYRLQFWGKPTTAGGPDSFLGDTDPVTVAADYEAEVSYQLDPEPQATFVVVFTRDATNNKFLETDRFDFP